MKRDRIENAIRHIKTATDVDPWAAEIAVEALKAQLSEEETISDCISRQAAIEAAIEGADEWGEGYSDSRDEMIANAIDKVPSAQPELQWHKCDQDDPSSFPDDDRQVLVSFSDSPIPAVGWFERNYDFCGWTDGELFGLHADGWWELPKKPEREEGEK